MFKRSHARATLVREREHGAPGACPKCGYLEVVGDSCARCRMKVSSYREYVATLDGGSHGRRGWFRRLRLARMFGQPLVSADRRSIYEELILGRIYRELRYPATARGIYLVLLAFDVTAGGRVGGLRLTVNPSNRDVGASVRTALDRAQPFPPPPPDGRDSESQRISLALTVNI